MGGLEWAQGCCYLANASSAVSCAAPFCMAGMEATSDSRTLRRDRASLLKRTSATPEVGHMRRTLSITVLLSVLLLVGGGLDGTAAASTSAPARSVRPPTWVEREVLWQSLSAGVAHPSLCRWLLTSPARAARLAGATRFLGSFPGLGRVVVVVVDGQFRSANANGAKTNRLFLVLEARDHACLVQGITSARHLHLRCLGRLHRYLPKQSLSSGLWGQSMIEGLYGLNVS